MKLPILLLLSFPAFAGEIVLENNYVRVTRDAAPCALAHVPECTDRVLVAVDDMELTGPGTSRKLARGDIAVFGSEDSYEPPIGAAFFEVSIKAGHPPARPPGEQIAPEKNAILYDGADYFVFEEKLAPGDTRARHSHSKRVVIQLNQARLEQWPDGKPSKIVETVPDRPGFSPPVIHKVRNIGETSLRGIIVEFKPR